METEAAVAKPREGFIYVASFAGYFKIGRTKDPKQRLRSLVAVKFPEEIQLCLQVQVDDAVTAEKALHTKYRAQRKRGEWFTIQESEIPQIKSFLLSGSYLTFLPTLAPRRVTRSIELSDNKEQKSRLVCDDDPTFDRNPKWKMRRYDLKPKPSLHDVPIMLKSNDVVNFARYPYSCDTASKALDKIGKRYGYDLAVIWDGPYSACVWKESEVNFLKFDNAIK